MKRILYKAVYLSFAVIFLWYVASFLIDSKIIPSPFVVLVHTWDIFEDRILIHCLYSLKRIFGGVFAALIIGWPAGICIGYFRWLDKLISPLVYFFYPTPKIAFLPILMLIFGLGDKSKIIIITLIIIFQVLISVRDFIKNLDSRYYLPLISIDAKPVDMFIHILIPASLPSLLSSIRIALATSISVLFFAETFGTTYGLGYYIMDAMLRINYVEMYSGILILSLTGFLLFALIDWIEKSLIKW